MNQRKAFGMSLVEILVGVAILTAVGIPMLNMFTQSRDSLARSDRRRECRYYVREIFSLLDRQSLHDLWQFFGPGEVVGYGVAGKLKHRLLGATGNLQNMDPEQNPLGCTPEFIQEMNQDHLDARIFFEFYTRKELEVSPALYSPQIPDQPSPKYGILHMQAGWAEVYLLDRLKLEKNGGNEEAAVLAHWKQPMMCPAIVGRPGLKFSSCPAVNEAVRRKYEPLLRRREASL
jgi:hypothetical protein